MILLDVFGIWLIIYFFILMEGKTLGFTIRFFGMQKNTETCESMRIIILKVHI